uniref:Heat shock protein beta-7-like n=1 Tax=Fundulus heteroclitus TaxID=8078 RepID=A0A3Q2TRR2_FUNHE
MASLTTSSQRSSSSYRSSSRYSTSSSYRSDGSLNGSSDSLEALFEPFIDSTNCSSLFGEEGPGGPSSPPNFSRHSRSSYGPPGKNITHLPTDVSFFLVYDTVKRVKEQLKMRSAPHQVTNPGGGTVANWQSGTGNGVRCLGDAYSMTADLSQFEPHDIVVMAYNCQVVIHAQKILDDGSISNTFTHKSLFPEDMDPLSVSGTLKPDGTLQVTMRRIAEPSGPEPLGVPTYSSEAYL